MLNAAVDEMVFEGQVLEWRGPAPFYFIDIPIENASVLSAAAKRASYGWGCVPVVATIRHAEFRTSLFPRNGSYLLPLKAAVRRALELAPGDSVEAVVRVVPARPSECCE